MENERLDWYLNWKYLSFNENAISLLRDNYDKMSENNIEIYEEIIKEVMKPSRDFKNPDYDYLEELIGD